MEKNIEIEVKQIKPVKRKTAILETNKVTGKKVLYTSIKKYTDIHKQYKPKTLSQSFWLKSIYEDDRIILEKLDFWQ